MMTAATRPRTRMRTRLRLRALVLVSLFLPVFLLTACAGVNINDFKGLGNLGGGGSAPTATPTLLDVVNVAATPTTLATPTTPATPATPTTADLRFILSGDTRLNSYVPYFYTKRPAAHRIGTADQWRDASGVRIIYVNGHAYNHPAIQAQDGLWALGTYTTTHSAAALTLAEKEGKRLIATHVLSDGAWWEPYRYDFTLYADPRDVARAPWYSGLAQAQTLDLFTRLYAVTHEAVWASAARNIFASFLVLQHAGSPWITRVDAHGYLWIEEYPTPRADDDTVNGLMFAALGLASYILAFQDARALRLFDGATATIYYALARIRRPGGMMRYSLSRANLAGPFHSIVEALCRNLASLAGDKRFALWAARFQHDYPTRYP